ncbi:MAG: SpoIIE family protein phosphatase [Spirochaetes bacterium]|nr:SpoIIE family protein phosphatase [Spirochaetota bacterium]
MTAHGRKPFPGWAPRRSVAGIATAALFAMALWGCTGAQGGGNRPRAEEGTLDLRAWSFATGPADLDGTWEFCWGSLYSPADFHGAAEPGARGTIKVPSTWISARNRGGSLPAYGHATYRLTVLLPEEAPRLSLRVPASDTAYRLFVNGRELFANGRVGRDSASSQPLHYAPVYLGLPQAASLEILMQMSNHDFPRPGLRDSLLLGDARALRWESEKSLALDLFVVGAIFIMAIYHLGLFYLRQSDRSSLYFALFCLSTLARLLVTGEGAAYRFTPVTWEIGSKLEYLTLAGWAVALLFLRSFFPREISLKVLVPVNAVIAALSGVVIAAPVAVFSRMLLVFDIVSILMIAYVLFALGLALARRREYAAVCTAGIVVFFAAVVNDMLLGYRLVDSVYVMPYGLFVFFFVQSYLLSSRFSHAFTMVEDLSHTLEERVVERTRELELERNKLEKINRLMDEEIDMARRLQEQLIPMKGPADFISTLYHPMRKVGGDFFDFIQFRDTDRIGIVICDVSGHGVSAAFITSMVKTILLQAGGRKNDPAELIKYMNAILYGNTAGSFCSMFYGIYNRRERSILYVNAGHNYPLIIDDGGIRVLKGEQGTILGVFDNGQIEAMRKGYTAAEERLPAGGKLLLYTDGLTEARHMDGGEVFFMDEAMNEVLLAHRSMPCGEFTGALFRRLVEFRGSDSFEDDVAIVCLDIV